MQMLLTRMYFFVGRSARWDAYVEIFNISGTFVVGETVSGGGWSATVAEVNENSILVSNVLPTATNTIVWYDTNRRYISATAKSGTYRYATEEAPPAPLNNYTEKLNL